MDLHTCAWALNSAGNLKRHRSKRWALWGQPESIGNEERFLEFIEKATNTEWKDKILCREKEEQNFVPITKATIEVKSNVVLENKFAKHKLLKKAPKDIDFEDYEKTLEDFK